MTDQPPDGTSDTNDTNQQLQQQINGSSSASNGPSIMPNDVINLANLSGDAKALLNSILTTGSPFNQANLQMLSAAAVGATATSQKLPIKPTTSANSGGVAVTPPHSTIASGVRKRGRPPIMENEEGVKRKKSSHSMKGGGGEKQSKGLRHFSQLVCEKVREKKTTTYNEVADELVKELGEAEKKSGQDTQIDQKNIRRRVYDALNVLMAMNIINKEKKEIQWIGLPTNSVQECEHIQNELSQYEERISQKTSELHNLVLQILTLKNLIKRNRERAELGQPPSHHSAIGLPFILVNTQKNTTIDCSISSDKSEYVFTFDNTFELHQDVEVLNKLGLDNGLHSGSCTTESLAQAKSMLPKGFEPILDDMAQLCSLANGPRSPDEWLPPTASNDATVTSTPTSSTQPAGDNLTTPTSVSNSSPLALAAALVNNPTSIAAALTQLQQIQQGGASPTPLRSGTVTARPLNFTSSSKNPPLIKPQQPGAPPRSPASKLVTVQPISNSVSMTDLLMTLQNSIMKQQRIKNTPQCENTVPPVNAPNALLSNKALEPCPPDDIGHLNAFLASTSSSAP